MQTDYDNAATRFGEDPTKVPSGDFFSIVSVRAGLPQLGVSREGVRRESLGLSE